MNQMTPVRTPAILFVLVSLVIGVRPIAAQELTLEEAYTAVESAGARLESWSADMRMTIDMMGMAMSYEGSLTGKGNLLKSEMRSEVMGIETLTKTTMDADGIQWVEINAMGMNMVVRTDMKEMAEAGQEMLDLAGDIDMANFGAQNPTEMLRVQGKMFDLAFLGTETREGIDVLLFGGPVKEEVLLAMAESPMAAFGMSLGSLRTAVGREDGLPRELIMENTAGDEFMIMRYFNIATDIGVTDADFAYTPPEGIVVMDYGELEQLAGMDYGELEQLAGMATESAMIEMTGTGEAKAMPEAHTQFDAATMPDAALVLRGSFETFAQRHSWTAEAVLSISAGDIYLDFVGAMMGRGSLFRGEFSASMFGAEFQALTIADTQGQFWTEMKAPGTTDVEHFDANTIERQEWAGQPMGVSPNRGPLSGVSGLYEEMREVYDLSNLGVATVDGLEVYVIELRLRDEYAGASISIMMESPAEVFTLLIGIEDNFPYRLISRAIDGETLDLKLSNFEFDVELEDELFKYTPPSVIIEEDK
jgi:outer membrane lipoprotein-sorting protein